MNLEAKSQPIPFIVDFAVHRRLLNDSESYKWVVSSLCYSTKRHTLLKPRISVIHLGINLIANALIWFLFFAGSWSLRVSRFIRWHVCISLIIYGVILLINITHLAVQAIFEHIRLVKLLISCWTSIQGFGHKNNGYLLAQRLILFRILIHSLSIESDSRPFLPQHQVTILLSIIIQGVLKYIVRCYGITICGFSVKLSMGFLRRFGKVSLRPTRHRQDIGYSRVCGRREIVMSLWKILTLHSVNSSCGGCVATYGCNLAILGGEMPLTPSSHCGKFFFLRVEDISMIITYFS